MPEAILYYFTKPDPNRPIEEQHITEIKGIRNSFVHQEDAMLYLFDNGIRKFNRLTKEIHEYKNASNLPVYELWQIENRVGYVLYAYEQYLDENDNVKKRRAFIWRFIGFGSSCFAKTKKELKEKVLTLIHKYQNEPVELGYNTYPYFTKHHRRNKS